MFIRVIRGMWRPEVAQMARSAESELIRDLEEVAPGSVTRQVPLARVSRWRIGGPAKALVEPASSNIAARVLELMAERQEPLCVIGESSNVLFDSAGFDGVILRIARRMSKVEITGEQVWAEAGIAMPELARIVGATGLSGIEHTVGIPGTLGGLVLMNGGSQQKGIGLNVASVECVDRTGQTLTLDQDSCGFGYRRSTMQDSGVVVLGACLQLERRDPAVIRRQMTTIMMDRLGKFPSNQPNCGSTFLSDPAMYQTIGPPGRAIESVGLKGVRFGGAQVSPLHANFIVNTGTASSDDVLGLIALIRSEVLINTGYLMNCEVRHLGREGLLRPAHEAASERWHNPAQIRRGLW